jgi:lipopolysaccharide transport system permease protein
VSLCILLGTNVVVLGTLHWTTALLPLVILPLIFLSLALTWWLASLGVFVRDIGYTVALIVQVLFFLTPIFYAIENIPEPYRTLIGLNPLTPIIENVRRTILWGLQPNWTELASWIVATSILMLLGYAWFMKTKKAFADVL